MLRNVQCVQKTKTKTKTKKTKKKPQNKQTNKKQQQTNKQKTKQNKTKITSIHRNNYTFIILVVRNKPMHIMQQAFG